MRGMILLLAIQCGFACGASAEASFNPSQTSAIASDGALPSADSEGQDVFDFPRVATNQRRPGDAVQSLAGDDDLPVPEYIDPYDGTGAQPVCIVNHTCSGGALCATGECVRSSEGKACAYCTGYKCKNTKCL